MIKCLQQVLFATFFSLPFPASILCAPSLGYCPGAASILLSAGRSFIEQNCTGALAREQGGNMNQFTLHCEGWESSFGKGLVEGEAQQSDTV